MCIRDRSIQLADDIIKGDLYTVYYAVSETNVEVVNPDNNQNEIGRQKEQADSARKQQTDLDGKEISEIRNSSDVNVTRIDESITDVTGKSDSVKADIWIRYC